MSRIHDALRRGGASAPPFKALNVNAASVPASFGFRPDSARGAVSRLGPILAVVLVAAVGWAFWGRGSEAEVRGATSEVRVSGASVASVPVPSRVPAPAPNPVSLPSNPVPPSSIVAAQPSLAPATTPAAVETAASSSRSAPPPQPRRNEPRISHLEPRITAADPFQIALYHQRAGDFEQALVNYKAALQRDELNIEAHNNLGYLYLGKGLLEDAAREFQRVIAIEPKYVTAHVNLSATLFKLNRVDAAAAHAREALALDPRNGDAMVNLALAQKASGQPADAQVSLRRALELNPRSPAAHYNLARQYEDAGEAARALDHYRLFLQYAGPEQSDYAQDVRQRLPVLQTRIK